MFTGIIEEVGSIGAVEPQPAGSRIRVHGGVVTEGLRAGDSVSVNGVCLTAIDPRPGSFAADVSPETLRRSNLGALKPNSKVNLERPMTPNARFGGHIVQGHVDGAGEIVSLDQIGGENWWLRVRVPEELDRYFVFKGSAAIDGISLTVAAMESGVLSVTIIPHTYLHTNIHMRKPGDKVNLECDVLAKYVEKMLRTLDIRRPLSVDDLRGQGY